MKRPILSKDFSGKRFGNLVAVRFEHIIKNASGSRRYYWLFKCDCGKEVIKNRHSVIGKNIKSCGCTIVNSKPKGESSFNRLYRIYKKNSKNRNKIFDLSVEEFRSIVVSNCHYCNSKPFSVIKEGRCNGVFIYNGIDRINNSMGYIKSNCVTCCKTCNIAKASMTYNEFINWIKRVYKHSCKEQL